MAMRDADECIRLDPMFSNYLSTRMILFIILHRRLEVPSEVLASGQVMYKESVRHNCPELNVCRLFVIEFGQP